MKKLSILLATAITLTACSHKPMQTFTEPIDPTPLTIEQQTAWQEADSGLNAAWGTPDYVYARSIVPQGLTAEYATGGWRGERVSAQLLLWSKKAVSGIECKISDFKSEDATLPSSIATPHFVRYTIADVKAQNCRCDRFTGHPSMIAADMLDNLEYFDMEASTTRPVWISIRIPSDAKPGIYKASIKISHNGIGSTTLPLQLEVIDQVLAAPSEWAFHLDLWQHPSAVARVENVDMWSDEHFEAMRPYMQMLADAGQKVITATLNRDPWRYQCFDDYEPMILWTKNADGSWSYDYTIFDRWVEFMLSFGIDKYINCYSMLPWGECTLDYRDAANGNKRRKVDAIPGTPAFEQMWAPFISDFAKHLREKGWINKVNMAIDERKPEDIKAAADLLAKYAPEIGFAMADNHNSYKKFTNMRDVCVGQRHTLADKSDIEERRAKGLTTTFYVCCSTLFPNVFTYSQPYEAELLCAYGVAHDYDGLLRWAYNSWPARPEYDSRFRYWASGDTYMVYPGVRSSVRFERLVDGVEFTEKVRTLRAKYSAEQLKELDEALAKFKGLEQHSTDKKKAERINNSDLGWEKTLAEVNQVLLKLSKELAE